MQVEGGRRLVGNQVSGLLTVYTGYAMQSVLPTG